MLLRQIYDADLSQYAYLIGCEKTREAIVIDPERDVDRYRALATAEDLKLNAVAETHIHADFVSGAPELAADPAVRVFLSAEGGPDWQSQWARHLANVGRLRAGGKPRPVRFPEESADWKKRSSSCLHMIA